MVGFVDFLRQAASEGLGAPYKYGGNTFYFRKEPFYSPERPYLKRYVMQQEIGSKDDRYLEPPVTVLARNVDKAAAMAFYWNRVVGPPNVSGVTLRESEKRLPGQVFIQGTWTGRDKPVAVSGFLWEWRERQDRAIPNEGGVYITHAADPILVGSVLLSFTDSATKERYDNSRELVQLDPRIQAHLKQKIIDRLPRGAK